jgi:glycosyltransferase involved in cell wall biosynthesis
MSVLEAMSLGTPVVCTRVGGLPELIVDGKTGLFAEVGDATSTANGILQLLADPVYAGTMAAAAFQAVQARCSLSAVERDLRRIYGELAAIRGTREQPRSTAFS